MTAPNRNVLWARALVDELAAGGLRAACVAPGSRSTPLAVALAGHDDVRVLSHLDERSAAFFALGRGRRTGEPTALVCTSGTAAANFHPAVIEAHQARVPLLVLTADRPPELADSGANQTVDQSRLYGDAVRWFRDLPEPAAHPRKLRSLRTTAARALAAATGAPPGPVHCNVPFRKPLEPTEVPGGVPEDFADDAPLAARGRDGPFVETASGRAAPADAAVRIDAVLAAAERPLLVAGPAVPSGPTPAPFLDLARSREVPLLADPLSGLRFAPGVERAPVVGGYDAYLGDGGPGSWPAPDLVLRIGASPTSKALRRYLAGSGARQVLVDPAVGWREAEFAASDLVAAAPGALARALLDGAGEREGDAGRESAWLDRWRSAERVHRAAVDDLDEGVEGEVVARALADAPDPATVFVSNSTPVRDADRFARPRGADLTVLGNRGASGIDGIVSTALGAGSATDDPLVLVTGDLAYYHDANGLLAVSRCDVDATVVLLHNDGGGIFHALPIESFDPPFTDHFRTPHGLDFSPLADLHGFEHVRVSPAGFADAYGDALASEGTHVVSVQVDAERSHRTRERLAEQVRAELD